MGQKTNPNIFQLNKTAKWDSIYIEKKAKEQSLYNFRDLEIKKFIIKFFKDRGLTVQSCRLSYFNNSLNVFISYQQQVKSIKLVNKINKFQKIKFRKNSRRRAKKNKYQKKYDKYRKKYKKQYKKYNKKKSSKKTNTFKKIKKKKLRTLRKRNYRLYCLYRLGIKKQKIFWMSNAKIKKKTFRIIRSIKNFYNYENLSYKKAFFKTTNNNNIEKTKKVKRSKYVNFYKKYLNLKRNKNVNNVLNNNFLSQLFQSLNLFYNKKLLLTLILKPLSSNTKKNLNKQKRYKLKKSLVGLKKFQNNKFFKEGINLIFSAVSNKNSAELISKYIATTLKKFKSHNFFLKFIEALLIIFIIKISSKIVTGIKIKIKGRINRSHRAKSKIINIGKNLSILKIDSSIKYSESTAYTSNGTIGIKVWVCEKNVKKKYLCLTDQKK